jgi:uncharacterized protein YbbK (DUF523 family)
MAPALPAWRLPDLPIRVGISSCLLGEEVRYDGGHQKDAYVTGVLARDISLVPVCPEMEVGMGVPREAVRLVGDAKAPRMLGVKRGSPSCGMERVKLYAESGALSRSGTGLFARALGEALPLLPVEEEGRLENARLRENFITRVSAYRRLAALRESRPRPADVAAFHAAHEYLLLAHRPAAYARLGGLVAELEDPPRDRWLDRLRDQVYLRPHPKELMLHNHV